MGLLTRFLGSCLRRNDHNFDTILRGPTALTPRQPQERRRAAVPIGHPDVAPPSPSFLAVAQERWASALKAGALAGKWNSSKYYERYGGTDHPERDGQVYAIRGNGALMKGLMQPSSSGFSDEITGPCEELGCQCQFQFIYNLRDLPDSMIAAAGRRELERIRALIR